jgi:hypothetical protein
MIKKFENITVIDNRELFDEIAEYEENLIQEATANGSFSDSARKKSTNRTNRSYLIGQTSLKLSCFKDNFKREHQRLNYICFVKKGD